jgi:hypothetical protein
MAQVKISSRLHGWDNVPDAKNLSIILNALQDDLTAIRTSMLLITAKLDADAGVTGTDYAATTNPAALTLIK